MAAGKPQLKQFEIGTYLCPQTKLRLPLMAPRAVAFMDWPVVVEKCAGCGQEHVLQSEDVLHRPAFGYE